MKKVVLSFIALTLCLMMAVSVSAAGVTVTLESQKITQSEGTVSVVVPISISGNTGIAGIELLVTYADGLTLTKMEKGDALSSFSFVVPGKLSANPIKVAMDGESKDTSNGVFMNLTFEVSAATPGVYPITMVATPGSTYDDNLDDVDVTIVNGSITVEASAPVVPEEPKLPEITPVTSIYNKPYTYVNESGVEETVASGITFARAEDYDGYELAEYGMLFTKDVIDVDDFIIDAENVLKAEGKSIGATGKHYGILFYGPGVKYGVTYYTLPYAIYKDVTGNETIVYGNDILSFTPEM